MPYRKLKFHRLRKGVYVSGQWVVRTQFNNWIGYYRVPGTKISRILAMGATRSDVIKIIQEIVNDTERFNKIKETSTES